MVIGSDERVSGAREEKIRAKGYHKAAVLRRLAIRPVVHLAPLQKVQPVLAADNNASEDHLEEKK